MSGESQRQSHPTHTARADRLVAAHAKRTLMPCSVLAATARCCRAGPPDYALLADHPTLTMQHSKGLGRPSLPLSPMPG